MESKYAKKCEAVLSEGTEEEKKAHAKTLK